MSSPTDASHKAEKARQLARAQGRAGAVQKLGGLALLVVAGLAVYFVLKAGFLAPPAPQEVKSSIVIANPDVATGENARINGFDRNNHPYEITAKSGIQDKAVQSLVHLDGMTANFIRPAGENLTVTSDKAQYDNKTKVMDLKNNVVLVQGQKFKAMMDAATVNTVDQTLQSKSAVVVEAQGGVIHADSLTVTENGNRVLFKGGVKAHFEGKQ